MAIQVYDMGLDFTKGEGTSISDFRLKQAQANQADATANKYDADRVETERKNAAAEKQKADFEAITVKNTDPQTGKINREGMEGDTYNYLLQHDPKAAADFGKELTAEKKVQIEIREKHLKQTEKGATYLARNPTIDTAQGLGEAMVERGNKNGQVLLDWVAANQGASEEEIKSQAMRFVPDAAKKPVWNDMGGYKQNTNPLYTGEQILNKTATVKEQFDMDKPPPPGKITSTTSADGTVSFWREGKLVSRKPGAGKPSATYEKQQSAIEDMIAKQDELIPLLEQITKDGDLIDQSTGSGVGHLVDLAAAGFGHATEGSIAIAS